MSNHGYPKIQYLVLMSNHGYQKSNTWFQYIIMVVKKIKYLVLIYNHGYQNIKYPISSPITFGLATSAVQVCNPHS
jgi:hypothetical protein